ARTGEPVLLGSREAIRERYPDTPAARPEARVAALATIPLTVRGRAIGALGLSFQEEQAFDDETRAMMLSLARQCAQAVERARLFEAERRARAVAEQAADRIARLQAVTAALSEALTPAQVAEVVVREAAAAFRADGGFLSLLAPDVALELVYCLGYPDEVRERLARVPLDAPLLVADSIRTRQAVLIESREALEVYYGRPEAVPTVTGHQAFVAIPLLAEARTIGALELSFAEERRFSLDDREFMLAIARQAAQAIARARLYEAERRARAEAEQAVRAREEFLSIASHELKTPLTTIKGYIQLLARNVEREQLDPERLSRALARASQQADRLEELIGDLLDVSRIQGGRLELRPARVDLAAVAAEVVERFRDAPER
ncbi:MAG: GAF domain-containing protein, partial [Thermomicrobiaceae bacterium]|nr:GAF domain-containing protein [Thermomicrobiaceae bacterium]